LNTRKKVFCFILPSYFKEDKGGAELQCYYLAQELISRDWEVHYIREHCDNNYKKDYMDDGIRIHGIRKIRDELRWMNINQLAPIMNTIDADCWYCRATISYLYPVLKNARKIEGSKVIWSCCHDKELKTIRQKKIILKLLYKFNEALFKNALQKIDTIVLQTNHQKNLLRVKYKLSGTIIYNAHPRPKSYNSNEKQNTIVWIGRLQPWKHPEIFVQIAEQLETKPYKFVAIGKPLKNNDLKNLLIDAQKKLSNFEYKGELENSHVCQIISEAKLLICTSDHEGFSNTFIEAWARGVPVISLRVDPDNLLQEKKIGLLSNSIEQLCIDIDLLLQNPEMWSKFSMNCIHFFETHLTINKAVDKLEYIL